MGNCTVGVALESKAQGLTDDFYLRFRYEEMMKDVCIEGTASYT